MTMKRKRSSDASPVSISSFSTRETQSPTPFPQTSNAHGWNFTNASRVKSGEWGNRTCKRVRDNRPEERVIHDVENTLDKLFAAQRSHPHAAPISSDALPAQQPTLVISKPQTSTLHSFWKQLPAPPVQTPIFTSELQLYPTVVQSPRCDDCESPLQSEGDGMDVDTDVGGAVECNPFACSDCGKNVCGICAVVSTTRHCLQCATTGRNSRRWW
ncbi:hypothetical protein P153DRAFT_334837 [Dothidotthia symphoricarpi CBS 119687]|uniref:Uncharacterized protein n=1 Tax=Dothidotthia symphoricarpi CBS 119687 TaxID=1392245 RepID=A0A6A6AM33_9PLEO|nr:uncharacterized protein P153DRAFT_334837 [Dothidotthia symphoricarpi CBS 119687]KAF2132188.1 hypothetical protein P153DRAFT_334837 [Dothidotthia symphoricarpi CBS 119687]